jgi:hypothetical protein
MSIKYVAILPANRNFRGLDLSVPKYAILRCLCSCPPEMKVRPGFTIFIILGRKFIYQEEWQSGLMYRSRKPEIPHGIRGFESPLLCEKNSLLNSRFFLFERFSNL